MALLNSFVLACIINSILNICLGIFVVIKGNRKILYLVWGFFCLSVALWSFGLGMMTSSASEQTALFWLKYVHYLGLIFLPITFMHFCLVFFDIHKSRMILIIITYSIGVFLLITNFAGFLASVTPLIPFKFYTKAGVFYPVFGILFLYTFVYAFFEVFRRFRKAIGYKKIQLKYFFIGTFIGFLGGSTAFFPVFNLPLFPYGIYSFSIYTLIVSYAIIRYHLMDIEIVIKRSTIYAILIAFTTGVYISLIFLSESMLQGLIKYSALMVRIIAAIIIALTFLPIRNLIENFIDKVFFRQKIDYIQALTNLSQSLISMIDLRVLMNTIVKNIMDIMKIEKACLLLHDKNLKGYQAKAIAGFEDSLRGDLFFSTKNRIVLWIKNIKDIIIREIVEKYDDVDNIYRNSIINQMRELKLELIIPLFFDDHLIGLIVLGKKKNDNIFSQEELNILKSIGNQASIAFSNAIAYDDLKKIYLGTIEAFVKAIEAKDYYTKGHSERVVKIAMKIAKEMQISREQIELLQYAGVLHDIGKIGIDNEILRKPESLTDLEYIEIKKHPVIGKNIVQSIKFLEDTAKIILHHHERWDGGGYPHKLKKLGIPLLSRILCIADSFDAMTSNRPYRPAMTDSEAVEIIKKSSGKQFDPVVVKYFVALYEKNSLS